MDKVVLEGVLSKGYGLSPKMVMRDRNLTIEAKGIYAYMSSFAGNGVDEVFPSMALMAEDLGISEERVRKHRKLLEKHGYIEVTKDKAEQGKFARNIYTIKQIVSIPELSEDGLSVPGKHRDGEIPCRQNPGTNNNTLLNNNININNNINNKKTIRPRYSDDNEHYKMAYYLFEKIRENSPTFKEPNFQVWANDMRLMVERDKRTDKVEIKNLIDFCQSDSFWMSNILSAATFRKQYDKLLIKFNQRGNKRGRKSIQASSQQSKLTPDYGF